MSYDHAIEKLTNAMEVLATHPGDVRERVGEAYLYTCAGLQARSFPEKLQKDWEWIEGQLTKYEPLLDHKGEVWRGSVEVTIKRIRKSTGVKIAKRFYYLYWELSANEPYA
jgi:hypothetical protein